MGEFIDGTLVAFGPPPKLPPILDFLVGVVAVLAIVKFLC